MRLWIFCLNHEAIFFHLGLAINLPVHNTRHPILLYHKGNLDGLKADMLEFQNQFMSTDPYSYDIEINWLCFKLSLNSAINKNIPQRLRSISHGLIVL